MVGTETAERKAPGYLRHILPLFLGTSCLVLLGQQMSEFDWSEVGTALNDIRWSAWGLAILATAVSYCAVAQYDVVAHRHLRSPLPDRQARASGATAVALGQLTGFGPLVGILVRWYLAPGLRKSDALAVTGFVTFFFLSGLAVLSIGVFLPLVFGAGLLALVTGLISVLSWLAVLWVLPKVRIKGRVLAPPTLRAGLSILVLTAMDIGFAALALWLLLPAGSGIGFWTLTPVFCLALGAGLVSGLPGGAGPFELVLLSLLPSTEAPALVAALVAYRGAYCLLPALFAGCYLVVARPEPVCRMLRNTALPPGPRAEASIATQSETRILAGNRAVAQAIVTRQSLMLFLGAHRGSVANLLPELKTRATSLNRWPCLYKLSAQDAAVLRRKGWTVTVTCLEARIDPMVFTPLGPEHRQLRRALRRAQQAGVTVRHLHSSDWDEMARINDDWVDRHQTERGVTMGRFCPDWLADKPLYGAFVNGRLVAFASAVAGQTSLSLDLMRHHASAPPGTMHLLTWALIEHARRLGMAEFSLAAVPHPRLMRADPHSAGLLRFKQSFAPRWRPLYMAAPNPAVLALCAADIWWCIGHPPPIVAPQSTNNPFDCAATVQEQPPAQLQPRVA